MIESHLTGQLLPAEAQACKGLDAALDACQSGIQLVVSVSPLRRSVEALSVSEGVLRGGGETVMNCYECEHRLGIPEAGRMTRQLIAFGILSAGDALSTAYALTLPEFSEANALAASFGGGMYAFKAVATLSVIVVVWRLRHRCAGFVSRWALRGGIAVTALVVASNLAQLAVAP